MTEPGERSEHRDTHTEACHGTLCPCYVQGVALGVAERAALVAEVERTREERREWARELTSWLTHLRSCGLVSAAAALDDLASRIDSVVAVPAREEAE